MRNTEPVLNFKAELVKAFFEAKRPQAEIQTGDIREIDFESVDEQMALRVARTSEKLENKKIALNQAQAIFTGAKVYALIRGLRQTTVPALEAPPNTRESEELFVCLAERLETDGYYNLTEIRRVADEMGLFEEALARNGSLYPFSKVFCKNQLYKFEYRL